MMQFLVAAPCSGSGKTTLTCALLAALKRRGADPCAFKSGPDYIDPMFHRAVLGVESHNLDLFFSAPDTVRTLYAQGAAGHGAAVCEGAMGFYDGLSGVTDTASAWHLADTLGLPVLLVVPAKGASLTLAAQINGLKTFRTPSRIVGVLLNDCTSALYKMLKPMLERETGLPVLGHLPRLPEASIESRHLGLKTAGEIAGLQQKIALLADALVLDWVQFQALTDRPAPQAQPAARAPARTRIAVAQDEAFCFAYAETLEALTAAGAHGGRPAGQRLPGRAAGAVRVREADRPRRQPAVPRRRGIPRPRVPPLGLDRERHGVDRCKSQWPQLGLRLCQGTSLCGFSASVLGRHPPAPAVRGSRRTRSPEGADPMTEPELKQLLTTITPPSEPARAAAHAHWASLAKPLGGLGALETLLEDAAALTGTAQLAFDRRAVLVLCADNGVVAQGVSQTDQSVTRAVAENLAARRTSVCQMAKTARCEVVPVDMGMAGAPVPGVVPRRIAAGTADFTQGPAMTRAQAVEAIAAGIELVRAQKAQGVQLLATGEMGIGNTTTSSAVAAVLLGQPVEVMTGRGAGLSDAGLARKLDAIRRGIARNQPDAADPLDVLSKLGGFDIAGLCGVFLGGALEDLPILMDGFISGVAALCAVRLCPAAAKAVFASHCSTEPAARLVLEALGKAPLLTAGLHLGEGTGAVASLPLWDLALAVYDHCYSFTEGGIPPYTPQC